MVRNAADLVNTLAAYLANLLYPMRCLVCETSMEARSTEPLCDRCRDQIRPNPKPWCIRCGRSVETAGERCSDCRTIRRDFTRAYSAHLYEGVIKECVHLIKYRGKEGLSRVLSRFMIDFVNANPETVDAVDAIVPVPLSATKLRERGYNQSELLAQGLSRAFNLPLIPALVKTRSAKAQSGLKKDERMRNVRGAFGVRHGAPVRGKKILIVDDVFTTGSTLNECASALLGAGARDICALTLARGI